MNPCFVWEENKKFEFHGNYKDGENCSGWIDCKVNLFTQNGKSYIAHNADGKLKAYEINSTSEGQTSLTEVNPKNLKKISGPKVISELGSDGSTDLSLNERARTNLIKTLIARDTKNVASVQNGRDDLEMTLKAAK